MNNKIFARILIVVIAAFSVITSGTLILNFIVKAATPNYGEPQTDNSTWKTLQLKTFFFTTPTPIIIPEETPVEPPAEIVACGYPYASGNPRTNIKSDENTVLRAFSPSLAGINDKLKVWYGDEHGALLGVNHITVTTQLGTSNASYPVTPLTKSPDSSYNPQAGSTILSGIQGGIDVVGRPIFPSLFITDITVDKTSKSGDWQNGGIAIPPFAIFGTWKSVTKTVNATLNPPDVAFVVAPNPIRNNWNLDAGDPAPPGLKDEGYSAEVRWDVARLVAEGKMSLGHTYRVQFMVHDGDQTKSGGDEGEACATVRL